MTDAFDAIIAEVKASEAAQPQPEVKDAIETPDENAEVQTDEPVKVEGEEPAKAEEQFSKKAVNALSRRDKKIGKLQAEKQRLLEENEQLKKGHTPKENNSTEFKKPNPDDYKTWGEYLDARDDYNEKRAEQIAEKKLSESRSKDTEVKTKNIDAEILDERMKRRAELADEARKTFPDFDKVLDKAWENVQLLPHVIEVIDEADNGANAIYALAKEGFDLNELNDLTPAKAAMLIARYEDKGLELTKKKQVTNAPAPLSPNKGNGSAGSALASRSVEELLKWQAS